MSKTKDQIIVYRELPPQRYWLAKVQFTDKLGSRPLKYVGLYRKCMSDTVQIGPGCPYQTCVLNHDIETIFPYQISTSYRIVEVTVKLEPVNL